MKASELAAKINAIIKDVGDLPIEISCGPLAKGLEVVLWADEDMYGYVKAIGVDKENQDESD